MSAFAELWRPVLGFEGSYSVSDHGRVRSEPRKVKNGGGRRAVRGRVLKIGADGHGYPQVSLSRESVVTPKLVASLVLCAFRGPKPPGLECCHNDGVKTNCRLGNLRYDTRRNNHADKINHGTDRRGEKSATAKLTAAKVLAIRADKREQKETAAEFGIAQSLVSRIKTRKAWAHL